MSERHEPRFLDALRALRTALDALGAPAMCIGGVAVIALGVPRYTADIDATVSGAMVTPERILAVFANHGIVPRINDAAQFARERQVLLLRHETSGVPLDISLAWLPFEEEAIRSARDCDYAGVLIRVPRPEDLVIYKIVASRPRDIDDAEKLLLLHGSEIDVKRLRRVIAEFVDALEDPGRREILERLLRQAGMVR